MRKPFRHPAKLISSLLVRKKIKFADIEAVNILRKLILTIFLNLFIDITPH